jgi:hypothetical protein
MPLPLWAYPAIWGVCAAFSWAIADWRGVPPGPWAFSGLILGPIGILLTLILAKPVHAEASAELNSPSHDAAVSEPPRQTPVAGPIERWDSELAPPARYCSNCGALLTPSAKFCAACGQAVQAGAIAARANAPLASPPPVATPVVPEPAGGKRSSRPLIVAGIAVAVLVVGYIALTSGGPRATVAQADLPPAGEIWFGQTFDPNTFAINGRGTEFTASQTFAAVVHLTQTVDGSTLNMRISWNGQVVANRSANATGSGDIWAWTLGPTFAAGTWTYEITDVGGNALASGEITAR